MTRTLPVRNPRTGEDDYQLRASTAAETGAAAQRARQAQTTWASQGLAERIEALQRFKSSLLAQQNAIVEALSIDTGRYAIAQQELLGLAGARSRQVCSTTKNVPLRCYPRSVFASNSPPTL